jgi:ribosomal protein S12 methylthiotransferase
MTPPFLAEPRTSKTNNKARIGLISLGCPKTLVDSEVILGKLDPLKFEITRSVSDCDIALLNTCSFIQDAQQESVEHILDLVELKKRKKIKAVVVMGCLVQRFPEDLQEQLKDVDAFIGSGDYAKIPGIVDRVSGGDKVVSIGKAGYLSTAAEHRVALTPGHYRYVKISEGCDHICTFCSIPSFRGRHRSRTIEDVVTEARNFVQSGSKEIILTGQDTTYFGRDYSNQFLLPQLLQEVDKIEGEHWIRLLYAYPSCITQELMDTIRDSKHLCHYLDMPLQHASDSVLQAMKRGITQKRTRDLIHRFRETVADLAIRTTFIVGFPGETDKDFRELLDFIREVKFERLGVFSYSREEGTPSATMENQVPEKVKQERLKEAMIVQQQISAANNKRWIGKTLRVLIDGPASKRGIWKGRSYMDSPDVDANVRVESVKPLESGSFYNIKITGAEAYDLVGQL